MPLRSIVLSLVLTVVTLGVAHADEVNHAARTYRIGFIGLDSPGMTTAPLRGLKEELSALGYVEGRNLSLVYGWAEGDEKRIPALVRDVLASGVDVVTATCGPAVAIVRRISPTMPVVARCIDLQPLEGEVATPNRPGGYTTGVVYFSPGALRERLRLLRELLPQMTRLAVLYRADSEWMPHWKELEAAASDVKVTLIPVAYRDPSGFAAAFGSVAGADAFMTLGDSIAYTHRARLFAKAADQRLPGLYDFGVTYEYDALMTYAGNSRIVFGQVARQIHRIFGGETPATIPIETPAEFVLTINLRVAKRLGLTVPPSLLRRANAVIDDDGLTAR
jgi:putative ABC transport system substrate-binding protein